ncbi:MAG: hypothetical protein JF606_27455 [Burkholderiales bacterium]|nr:hypothetical protein [Burkholderiales bacterium]
MSEKPSATLSALASEFLPSRPSCSRQEAIEYARERARVRLLVEIGNPARHLIPALPEPLTDFVAERLLLEPEIHRQQLGIEIDRQPLGRRSICGGREPT